MRTNHSRSIFLRFGLWRVMSEALKPAEARGALWGGDSKTKTKDVIETSGTVCVARFNSIAQHQVIVLVSPCPSCLRAQKRAASSLCDPSDEI